MPERIDALDGIRGLAVLAVFMSHTSGRGMAIEPWLNFTGIGHVGVYLFFSLSAFLMTRNLMRNNDLVRYAIKRVFRILPLYYLVLTAVLFADSHVRYDEQFLHIKDGWEGYLRHLVFLQGDGIFWSVAIEFPFYFVLPIMLALTVRFGPLPMSALMLGYGAWYIAVQYFKVDLPPLALGTTVHKSLYLDVFFFGALAALVDIRRLPKFSGIAFLFLWALTLAAVARSVLGAGSMEYGLRFWSPIYAIVFALTIRDVADKATFLVQPLSMGWLRYVGKVGYSWYLVHFAVIEAVSKLVTAGPQVQFVLSALGCLALATLLYKLVEEPSIAVGNSLARRAGGRWPLAWMLREPALRTPFAGPDADIDQAGLLALKAGKDQLGS